MTFVYIYNPQVGTARKQQRSNLSRPSDRPLRSKPGCKCIMLSTVSCLTLSILLRAHTDVRYSCQYTGFVRTHTDICAQTLHPTFHTPPIAPFAVNLDVKSASTSLLLFLTLNLSLPTDCPLCSQPGRKLSPQAADLSLTRHGPKLVSPGCRN